MVSLGHNELKSSCEIGLRWMLQNTFNDKSSVVQLMAHYCVVITGAMTPRITSLTIVYSTVYSGADQRKLQSSASLAFVWGVQRRPVNSQHKWLVTRKMLPFDDVIMYGAIIPGPMLIQICFHMAWLGRNELNEELHLNSILFKKNHAPDYGVHTPSYYCK